MSTSTVRQQADGHEDRILAEHELAGRRVVLESLDATDPAVSPTAPYGYRLARVADPETLRLAPNARVALLDRDAHRIEYGVVRSWNDEGLNVAALRGDIHLSTVDDDLEPLPFDAPLTDRSRRYWLLSEVGR